MSENKYTFRQFLSNTWWFFLLSFAKAFSNASDSTPTGSVLIDLTMFGGVILLILYTYWFIRYNKNNK